MNIVDVDLSPTFLPGAGGTAGGGAIPGATVTGGGTGGAGASDTFGFPLGRLGMLSGHLRRL